MASKHLRVVPNPFAAELHNGRPNAFVQYDPDLTPNAIRYINVGIERKVVNKRARVLGGVDVSAQQDRIDITVSYDLSPVPIEDTQYHRSMIVDGGLLPADEATAKIAKVTFVPVQEALVAAMRARIDEYRAQHNKEPSLETWGKQGLGSLVAFARKGGEV